MKRKRTFAIFIIVYLAGIFLWFAFVSMPYHIPL